MSQMKTTGIKMKMKKRKDKMLKLVKKIIASIVVVLGLVGLVGSTLGASEKTEAFFNPGPYGSSIYSGVIKDITPKKSTVLYHGHRYVTFSNIQDAHKLTLLFGKQYLKVLVIFTKATNTFNVGIRSPGAFEPVTYLDKNVSIDIGDCQMFDKTDKDYKNTVSGTICKEMENVFEFIMVADRFDNDGNIFHKEFRGIIKN
jgi:hypothetical protein